MLEAADRTQALLDSLMVLARSQQALPAARAGRPRRRRAAPPSALAAEAAVRGVDVRLDLRRAPLTGDRPLIERLVANLVENAVRHNVPGGASW